MKRLIPPNPIEDWLATTMYRSELFYFDRWTFVHFTSGLALGVLLRKFRLRNAFWLALITVIGYETVEGALGDLVFRPEPAIDMIWDLIIGMAGFFVSSLIARKHST